MGLFGKKHLLNDDHLKKLVEVSNEAWSFFPGSLNGALLSFKKAEVNFLDESDRERFARALGSVLRVISKEPSLSTGWASAHAALGPNADRFAIASTLVAKTLVWIDMLAEAELQFPRDTRIKNLRSQLMNEVFSTLERYYGEHIVPATVAYLPHVRDAILGPLVGDWYSDK